jgi:hypothetical protein
MPTDMRTGIMYLLPPAETRLLTPHSLSLTSSLPRSSSLLVSLLPFLPFPLSPCLPHSRFPILRLSSGNTVTNGKAGKIHTNAKKEALSQTMSLAAGRGIIESSPHSRTPNGLACVRSCPRDCVYFQVPISALCESIKTRLQSSIPLFFHLSPPLPDPSHTRKVHRLREPSFKSIAPSTIAISISTQPARCSCVRRRVSMSGTYLSSIDD